MGVDYTSPGGARSITGVIKQRLCLSALPRPKPRGIHPSWLGIASSIHHTMLEERKRETSVGELCVSRSTAWAPDLSGTTPVLADRRHIRFRTRRRRVATSDGADPIGGRYGIQLQPGQRRPHLLTIRRKTRKYRYTSPCILGPVSNYEIQALMYSSFRYTRFNQITTMSRGLRPP